MYSTRGPPLPKQAQPPVQCLVVGCTFTDSINAPYFQRYRMCREHMRMPTILMDCVQPCRRPLDRRAGRRVVELAADERAAVVDEGHGGKEGGGIRFVAQRAPDLGLVLRRERDERALARQGLVGPERVADRGDPPLQRADRGGVAGAARDAVLAEQCHEPRVVAHAQAAASSGGPRSRAADV
jgi:hypothetical protein